MSTNENSGASNGKRSNSNGSNSNGSNSNGYRNNFSLSSGERNELFNAAQATAGNAFNKASQLGQSDASSNSGNNNMVLGSLSNSGRTNGRTNTGSLPSAISGNGNNQNRPKSPTPNNNWSAALNKVPFPNNTNGTPSVEPSANANAPWALPGNGNTSGGEGAARKNYGGRRLRKSRKNRKNRKSRKSRKQRKQRKNRNSRKN